MATLLKKRLAARTRDIKAEDFLHFATDRCQTDRSEYPLHSEPPCVPCRKRAPQRRGGACAASANWGRLLTSLHDSAVLNLSWWWWRSHTAHQRSGLPVVTPRCALGANGRETQMLLDVSFHHLCRSRRPQNSEKTSQWIVFRREPRLVEETEECVKQEPSNCRCDLTARMQETRRGPASRHFRGVRKPLSHSLNFTRLMFANLCTCNACDHLAGRRSKNHRRKGTRITVKINNELRKGRKP